MSGRRCLAIKIWKTLQSRSPMEISQGTPNSEFWAIPKLEEDHFVEEDKQNSSKFNLPKFKANI